MSFTNNMNLTSSLIISNLTSPYNDIKNTSNGVILAENQASYNITLSPGQQIEVGYFVITNTTSEYTISGCYATLNNATLNNTQATFSYTAHYFSTSDSDAVQIRNYILNSNIQGFYAFSTTTTYIPIVVLALIISLVLFLVILIIIIIH
jgi:hypothetical protein